MFKVMKFDDRLQFFHIMHKTNADTQVN